MNSGKWEKTELGFLAKIRNKFRYGLILQAIANQLNRIGIRISPYYWVQEGVHETEIPEIKGDYTEYSVVSLGEEDIKTLGASPWGDSVGKQIEDLKAGKICIALKKDSDIASFMWINLHECSYKPAKVTLNSDEAYLSNMYTSESYRGMNLAPYLRYKSYEFLKQKGRDKIYSITDYFNPSAFRYKEKLNAKNIRLVLYLEFFNRYRYSITLRKY